MSRRIEYRTVADALDALEERLERFKIAANPVELDADPHEDIHAESGDDDSPAVDDFPDPATIRLEQKYIAKIDADRLRERQMKAVWAACQDEVDKDIVRALLAGASLADIAEEQGGVQRQQIWARFSKLSERARRLA